MTQINADKNMEITEALEMIKDSCFFSQRPL